MLLNETLSMYQLSLHWSQYVFIGMIFYSTQVNKVLVRLTGVCLVEDVVVLTGYIPAANTNFY